MHTDQDVVSELIEIDGQDFYVINDVDQMPPFLVAVVSSSDHWMYMSSNGGLAAGRVNAQQSLFPYRTDDVLHEVHGFSGPWTGIRVGEVLWEPLHGRSTPGCSRTLARSTAGDRIVIEEEHHTLGLTLRSRWGFSERSGFVRTMTLTHSAGHTDSITLNLADGLRDMVAGGAPLDAMTSMSCLVNAYTRTDRVGERLATITMESGLSDVAEPAESLYANVVWSTGLPHAEVSVSEDTCNAFIRGESCTPAQSSRGQRGAYVLYDSITLQPGESVTWSVVADVHQNQSQVVAIAERLNRGCIDQAELDQELNSITEDMDQLISSTDGFQRTAQPVHDAHHRMNTLFNDMRGGIFLDHDRIPWGDWVHFLHERNHPCEKNNQSWVESRPRESWIDRTTLLKEISERNDSNLMRIGLEYLPVWFGRRHGDPSRPWNTFNIRVKNSDGSRRLTYEGNWRDIFQNWEALLLSEPEWITNVIAKFVNASTLDGFNPYRITREGIDWEVPDPGNP